VGVRKNRKYAICRAFTLVELLIVIILVAILAAIAIPKFNDSALRSREASLRANLKLIRDAGSRAEADTGLTFPVTALAQRTAPSSGWRRGRMNTSWTSVSVNASTWRGPYLSVVPVNPFSRNNSYAVTQINNASIAWTHHSAQTFNPEYYYYPSTRIGSNGRPYREW
jgi:prepilin-type N-terminal cleavage/methylation domain-containing protein